MRWIALMVALGGCSKVATGSETGACYPNNTCNAGLVCLSNVCVNATMTSDLPLAIDGGTPDLTPVPSPIDMAYKDAAAYNDAGQACPGAEIYHPGSETRMVGTSVPFVGHAQNAACMAIVGPALSWADNYEGIIGTGETFTHTFTVVGLHTVTLTAMDGANNYYAYVTFQITN